MPPKPEKNTGPVTAEQQIREQAMQGLRAQPTLLDRMNYLVNYQTYANMTSFLYNGKRTPRIYDDNDDPVEDPVLLDQERENKPETFFSLEEQSKLVPNVNRETSRATANALDDLTKSVQYQLGPFNRIEDEKRSYQAIGMLTAQYNLLRGKQYLKNLNSLPPDEENRELKAEYLTSCDLNGYMFTDEAYVDTIDSLTSSTASGSEQKFRNSVFHDAASLRQVTLEDFCDLSMMDPAEKEAFLKNAADVENMPPRSSIFDYYKGLALKNEQNRKAEEEKKGNHYEIREPDDETVCRSAFTSFYKNYQNACMHTGKELIRSNLSPEDQKALDIGAGLESIKTYHAPKPIREWVKEKGRKMTYENRVEFFNSSYEAEKQKANAPEPLGVRESPELKGSFPVTTEESTSYGKYQNKHSGGRLLSAPLEEKKSHLARFMAATILERQGKPYSVRKIHAMAEKIGEMKEFRKLNERETDRGLFNKKCAGDLQLELLNRTYSVPAEQRGSYIQEMRKLADNMTPKGSQSDEYKAMNRAVKEIAALDPNDPRIASKLMQANMKMMTAITGYAKGKKSVRTFEEGRARFGNCMDALSVVSSHVPGLTPYAKDLVDRTNHVRGVKPGDPDFVDLKEYGVSRAESVRKKAEPEQVMEILPGMNR